MIAKPCSVYGCHEPRAVFRSSTASRCAAHLSELRQGYREKNRPRAREYGRAYQKAYYAKNKDKYREFRERTREQRAEYAHAYYKRNYRYATYGLTEQDFAALLERQGGLCAICRIDDGKTLAVDHCHSTGRIRGLIHRTHNTAIGALGDNVEGLRRALAYLENPPAEFLYPATPSETAA